jgi:signal transduction histidine kinase
MVSQGVAHDFNNVLTGVSVNAKLAQRELPSDHRAAECLSAVLEASDYAQRLTDQLLSLAGKRRGETSCDVVTEVESIVRLLRSILPDGVQVHIEVKKQIPRIEVDPTRLQQVVMNLLLNAAEAVEAPSSIFLELDHEDSLVSIDIVDKGTGIPQSELARIFEPFFTSKDGGTGIGLSTAQHLVAETGGTICVETKVGRGTRMSVRYPAGTTTDSEAASDIAPDNTTEVDPRHSLKRRPTRATSDAVSDSAVRRKTQLS